MAAEIKVEINSAGVRDLLRSPEVMADLERRAQAIAAAAGDGFEVEMYKGRNRYRATVRTATEPARRAEATDRVLTRAIDSGR
jgi:hypothetical protein